MSEAGGPSAQRERLQREAAFHDRAVDEQTRGAAQKYYTVAARSRQFYYDRVRRHVESGPRILEYGCGTGSYGFELARRGGRVDGIDISPGSVEIAEREAVRAGLADRIHFQVMNAEALLFADKTFDVVCGSGILHHLDLDTALAELARVLKPEGRGVFLEPLGHNPLINLYRRLTPSMRTVDEHPLLAGDLHLMRARFPGARFRYFELLSLAGVFLRKLPGSSGIQSALEALDERLLRLPVVGRQAWIVVIELSSGRV